MTERTLLVTGASKGIGRALSNRLAAAGHRVIGLARNARDPSFPGELVAVDLADRQMTERVLDELCARQHIDGVVNNMGLVRLARLGQIDLDDVELSFRVNLNPAVQCVQALLPGMIGRGWGRVVNISSLTVLGVANRSAYAAAKAALISFTRTWALETARTGVTVNAIAPGPVETELFRQNTPVGSEAEQRFLQLVPIGRLGQPEEIAAAVAFLLSDEAGYITGQTVFVDGGASVGRAPI